MVLKTLVRPPLAAACLTVTAASALAQTTAPERGRIDVTRAEFEQRARAQFAAIDKDASGAFTVDEYVAFQEQTFKNADKNGDGVLQRGEARGFQPITQRSGPRRDGQLTLAEAGDTARRRFQNIDAGGDGAVSPDEYVSFRLANFDKADRNGDGRLTVRELRGLEPA